VGRDRLNFGNFGNIGMKLTRRQEEFVVNLIDLNRELDGPIHYSILAERLGVSPFTAYDMLCVLEEKGMVSSEYQLAEGKSGPGRAERLFCPVFSTADRNQRLSQKKSGLAELDEAQLKEFVLAKMRQGDFQRKDVALELLARIPPEGPADIRYCVEVMTVVAIRLWKRAGQQILLTYLPQILAKDGNETQAKLTLLGGFAFGLLVQEEAANDEWSLMLLEHVQHYGNLVMQMPAEKCRQLVDALEAVFLPEVNNRVSINGDAA
jgi:hypothetical protein